MIAAPEGAGNTHLRTLAALSRLLIDAEFIAQLMKAETPAEVTALFDSKQAVEEAAKAEREAAKKGKPHKRKRRTSIGNPTLQPQLTNGMFLPWPRLRLWLP